MSAATKNLWGSIPAVAKTKTPLTVLREQGRILEKETGGRLVGIVTTRTSSQGDMVHNFYIQAPLLGDYSHLLLSVLHGAKMFPLTVQFEGRKPSVKTMGAFENLLGLILKKPSTKEVINSLLAQSVAL
jgi:hypothetical protein